MEEKYNVRFQKCPLCDTPVRYTGRFTDIYKCNFHHGDFEWIDRDAIRKLDPFVVFNSLPYSIGLKENFPRMRTRYLNGLRNRILQYFPTTSDRSFLDVGCANGEYLDCAVALGMTPVMGVEIDRKAASDAMSVAPVVSDISEVKTHFDIIQCKNVIGNVYLFKKLLKQSLNLLKPGGILFLDVLNNYGVTATFKRLLGKPGILNPPYLINGFSKKAVEWLVNEHHAEVIKMRTAFCGSDMVPYRRKFRLYMTGIAAVAMKAGVMIIADVRTKKKIHREDTKI